MKEESGNKEVKVAYCWGRDTDEEVMDRIDGYLLLELLDWWKRWDWVHVYLVPTPSTWNPLLPVCPPPNHACTAQSLYSCSIIYRIVLAIALCVSYMMAQQGSHNYPEAVDTDWSVIALLGSLGNCREMLS